MAPAGGIRAPLGTYSGFLIPWGSPAAHPLRENIGKCMTGAILCIKQ